MRVGANFIPSATEVFVPAGILVTPNISVYKPSAAAADAASGAGDASWAFPGQFMFVRGVEDVRINAIHTAGTRWKQLSNPPTELVAQNGSIMLKFSSADADALSPPDYPMSVTVGQLLDAAGVTLDDLNQQPWLLDSAQPRYRHTGVVLLVKMHYSNWRNWELLPSDLCRITITVQRNAWGYGSNTFYDTVDLQTDGTLATSTTQHFTTGVTVKFVIGESLGYWDTVTMLVFLVASAALVRFGVFLVDAFMLSSPGELLSGNTRWMK
jgi:glutamine amidotransferase PdxT